jgi:hypothetical protein
VLLTSCAAEVSKALLTDQLTVRPAGWARGFLRLEFDGGPAAEYVALRGAVNLGRSGEILSVRLLLAERSSRGSLATDYALLGVQPAPSEECLIYDIAGGQVQGALEPLRFEVPGRLVAGRR